MNEKFLLDSCVSSYAVKDLREEGYDVLWIPEMGEDPGDEIILKKAFLENRILVTLDKDFGELVFVFGLPHPTIIRLVQIPARHHGKMILKLMETHREFMDQHALITVDPFRTRVLRKNTSSPAVQ